MTSSTTGPQVSEPGTAGSHGYPFGRIARVDLGAHGYRADEYFLEGEATRYRPAPGTELRCRRPLVGRAVRVGAVQDAGPWCTARRPGAVQRHGGAALEQRHRRLRPVLGRHSRDARRRIRLRRCHHPTRGGPWAARGAAGSAGVGPRAVRGRCRSRATTTPIDIFTQAARAVGPERDRDDRSARRPRGRACHRHGQLAVGRPPGHLRERHPPARPTPSTGSSCSSTSATARRWQSATRWSTSSTPPSRSTPAPRLQGRNRLRDDLDVPVMVVNSELEAISCYPVRQPDTDRFRYWEAAGTCHVSQQAMDLRAPKYERDFGTPLPMPPNVNQIPMTPLYDAALHHMHQWLTRRRGAAHGAPHRVRRGSSRRGPRRARHRPRRHPPPPGRGADRPEQRHPRRRRHLQHPLRLQRPVPRREDPRAVRRSRRPTSPGSRTLHARPRRPVSCFPATYRSWSTRLARRSPVRACLAATTSRHFTNGPVATCGSPSDVTALGVLYLLGWASAAGGVLPAVAPSA